MGRLGRLVVWLVVLAACADPLDDEVAVMRAGEVELVGVSGRRLYDDTVYRVPLDSGRALAVGAAAREALVLVNRGLGVATVERLTVHATGEVPAEWQVLMPTRARTRPLAVGEVRLEPAARLDFDVACVPHAVGVVSAELEVAWRQGDVYETRHVKLTAQAVGAPSATGPGPPR